jgi:guanine nucleotide-binding protein subunit alpha
MQESLVLFESVINSRWFLRTSVILFLNKIDVFKQKLPKVPLVHYFPEYTGGADINKAAKYILWRFTQTNRARLSVYPHLTQATDTSNVSFACQVCQGVKEYEGRGQRGLEDWSQGNRGLGTRASSETHPMIVVLQHSRVMLIFRSDWYSQQSKRQFCKMPYETAVFCRTTSSGHRRAFRGATRADPTAGFRHCLSTCTSPKCGQKNPYTRMRPDFFQLVTPCTTRDICSNLEQLLSFFRSARFSASTSASFVFMRRKNTHTSPRGVLAIYQHT